MTVQAYTDKFEYLARLYSQAVTKEWRCKKFEGGLNHKLRRFLVPLRIESSLFWWNRQRRWNNWRGVQVGL